MQIHKRLILLGLFGASACSEVPQSTQVGPNSLAGHATLISGGYSRVCEDVVLLPVTTEIDQRSAPFGDLTDGQFIGEHTLRPAIVDHEIQSLRRQAECARDGAFLFKEVPVGQYLLIARVTWSVRWARHGGYLVRKIIAAENMNDIEISIVKNNA